MLSVRSSTVSTEDSFAGCVCLSYCFRAAHVDDGENDSHHLLSYMDFDINLNTIHPVVLSIYTISYDDC